MLKSPPASVSRPANASALAERHIGFGCVVGEVCVEARAVRQTLRQVRNAPDRGDARGFVFSHVLLLRRFLVYKTPNVHGSISLLYRQRISISGCTGSRRDVNLALAHEANRPRMTVEGYTADDPDCYVFGRAARVRRTRSISRNANHAQMPRSSICKT